MKCMKYILVSIFVASMIAGCRYLDKMPDDMKTMDMVWQSRKETEAYLYNVYSQLPYEGASWEHCPWLGASDEADMVWARYQTASMNLGSWSPTSGYYNKWRSYYQAIRASFRFENNVDRCPELTDDLKTQYKAEVKFLRGYYYWKLLQQYGPVVLIDHEVGFNEDWAGYTRAPYDQCVEYIVQMLDEAEVDLPWEWDEQWLGKPTKFVCKAVKAEVLLTAASPQWNGNADYANFVNKDGTALVDTSYKQEKWEAAAAAARAVISAAEDNAQYGVKLYRNNEQNNGSTFSPYISIRDLWLAKWNCETIWARTGNDSNNWEKHTMPRPGGWSGMAATQRQVDAFYMIDGKTIDDSPLYTEEGFATEAHPSWTADNIDQMQQGAVWGHRVGEHNMFANREARFYAAILYNGRPIPQVSRDDRNAFSSAANRDGWGRAELYNSGGSGYSGNADHSETGYLILKNVNPQGNPYRDRFGDWRPHIYIRLAGVYLNYIEALNEYDPGHADIEKYWDMLRSRAGVPGIFEAYPEIAGNKERQREFIIRERQVELCFENDRYFTTRRRWIAHTTDTARSEDRRMFGDGGPMYGMSVRQGTGFADENFYQRSVFETRVFQRQFYLFPIPQDEINNNPLMVQNPWW